jgi:hypothetical protein
LPFLSCPKLQEIDLPLDNLRRMSFVAILLTFNALLNRKNKAWGNKKRPQTNDLLVCERRFLC